MLTWREGIPNIWVKCRSWPGLGSPRRGSLSSSALDFSSSSLSWMIGRVPGVGCRFPKDAFADVVRGPTKGGSNKGLAVFVRPELPFVEDLLRTTFVFLSCNC